MKVDQISQHTCGASLPVVKWGDYQSQEHKPRPMTWPWLGCKMFVRVLTGVCSVVTVTSRINTPRIIPNNSLQCIVQVAVLVWQHSVSREVSPSAGSCSCDGWSLLRAAEAAKEVLVRHHCDQLNLSLGSLIMNWKDCGWKWLSPNLRSYSVI